MNPLLTHQRQVHLDFHTSPFIPDVGSEFDATEFARAVKAAHINSITIFAKCHHGLCYYPTKTGTQHPALAGRDLMGEQIEALHREGIRCPLYTTVVWEEDVAQRFPEWRQLRHDGKFGGWEGIGSWRFNNYMHPDYQDYMEAHVREILANYEVDGLFFDILFMEEQSCWSEPCVRFREKHGLLATDRGTQARFQSLTQAAFTDKFSRICRGINKDAALFYNTGNQVYTDSQFGARTRDRDQTHWELESLPSGFWGYFHFPRLARTFEVWQKPWLGMTGRFQKMWGDFGGLKPQPALEYECFRTQALGGANSVGDQLPPRGTLDAGAYELIGAVFAQCEAAEPFYAGSTGLPQVGIVTPSHVDLEGAMTDKALEGAVQMCDEAHYDSLVLDDASDLAGLDLVILPDHVVVTPALAEKLRTFLERGGKLILSNNSGFDPKGGSLIPGVDLRQVSGPVTKFPTYWRAQADFLPALAKSDRVVYLSGQNVSAPGCEVLVHRVLPYFKRTALTFSSHFQTPPVADADASPAVVQGSNFIYFADPIFQEYRQAGNIAVRDGWREAMRRLVGPAAIGHGLASTILCVPRRRGHDLIISLLHYIPTRKALDIDMIEERTSFAGEILRLPAAAREVRVFGAGEPLAQDADGGFILPATRGRLLLEVPGFWI